MEVTELWADRLSEIAVPRVVVPDSEDLSILPQFGPERALKSRVLNSTSSKGWDINSPQSYQSSSRN